MRQNLLWVMGLVAATVVSASPAWGQFEPYPSNPPSPPAPPSPYYGASEALKPGNQESSPSDFGGPASDASLASGTSVAPGVSGAPVAPSARSVSAAPGEYPAPSAAGGNAVCDLCADCDDDARSSLVTFTGFESWRGVSELDWQSNNGMSTGFNYGTWLPGLKDYGVGLQFGASYGIYDWNGRGSYNDNFYAQQQIFITTGFFHKADSNSRVSVGLAYDWMVNDNFGIAASDGTLGQWRSQVGYVLNPHDEVGVWAAVRDRTFTQDSLFGPLTYRGVDQCNLFWHHKYAQGTDSYLWFGFPDHTKLGGDGSLGDFIIGGSFNVPISDHVALYSNVQYMHPSSSPGLFASMEDTWNIGFGIAFYPGHNARTCTVSGSRWTPLLNVANNGTFMVDSNIWTGI